MFITRVAALSNETCQAISEAVAHTISQVTNHKTSHDCFHWLLGWVDDGFAPILRKVGEVEVGEKLQRRKCGSGHQGFWRSLCFSKGGDSFK